AQQVRMRSKFGFRIAGRNRMRLEAGICLALCLALAITACLHQPFKEEKKIMDIQILSTAFREGEMIPLQYTCDGDNVSPSLRWGSLPKDAQSLALICEDPDAPSGVFTHWVIFNLPPIVSDLPEA